jgi:photosystem II stability/assembly factor-like uncharacterized protein
MAVPLGRFRFDFVVLISRLGFRFWNFEFFPVSIFQFRFSTLVAMGFKSASVGRLMKLQSLILRNSLFLVTSVLALTTSRAAAQSKPNSAPATQTKADGAQAQKKQSKPQAGLKPVPRAEDGRELVEEGPDFLRARQDWFFKPRAFPIGFIPQGARMRALEQKKQMYLREGRFNLIGAPGGAGFLPPPTGTSSNWFSIGPQATSTPFFAPFTSGRVTALAVNPMNANNVYLGGADGGLWVTTDGGTTWTALAATENPPGTGVPSIAVGSLAVDATSCGAAPSGICTTVYVGTGEDNFGGENIYGEGVLKCAVTAGTPPTAICTQDSTFHLSSGAPLDDLRGGPMIGALAVNPKTGSNNILLAGVRGRGTAIQSGVYCSQDSGVTWKPVFGISGIVGTDVAFASDGTAFVALGFPSGDAANNGIYKSKAPITASCPIDASGTAPSSSTNWAKQALPAGTPAASLGRITLAIAPSPTSTGANATVYAAIADGSPASQSSNLLGLIKTTNGGTTPWTQLTGDARISSGSGGICNGQCFYDMPLAVSPASPNDVFFGGAASNGTLIRSTDGGTTWTEISRRDVSGATDTIHVDMHAIAFSAGGSTMYVGNDGGAWKTTNPTLAGTPPAGFWTNLNQSLDITQFYPGVSIHPSNTGFSLGGTQDNDVQVYQGSNNMPLVWNSAQIGCDGGFTAIDFSIPSTSFGECEYVPNRAFFPIILVTFIGDGILGNGFFANSGIDNTDRGNFIPPLVMDPNASSTLYFGTCRVWASTDSANSWTAISPDLTTGLTTPPSNCPVPTVAGQPTGVLTTIAAAPGNSNVIYVGSDTSDIEVTSNGGTTWASIATATLPTRAVTQIAVDPSNPAIAYATFSGFGTCATFCTGPTGHVFKTINTGTAWIDISGNLPDIPVNAIVIDPADSTHNTLYVGTDVGGFFTTTGGATWSPLGAAGSLPNAQILSLTLHNPSRTLRAATHGRGVWDINLGPGPNTPALEIGKLSPFQVSAPGTATTLTVTGTGFTGSSTVMWNGAPRTTTPVSATQLTASISAADLASGAVVQVTVKDGTNTSNPLPFTVIGQPPTITSSMPPSAPVNSPAITLTVTGTNFGSSSKVIMNPDVGGTAILTTSFVSSTQLTATVPASFMANFGSTNSVGVQNPPPGGGTTVTTQTVTLPTFTVTAPAPANDNFVNATNITSTSYMDTKDSSGATTETNDPAPMCAQNPQIPFVTGRSNTIWYKVVPTGSGTANIDTIGSNYDTVLSVWSGTSQTALTAVACNDDINPGIIIVSQVTNVPLNVGTTYYIMVSSFGQADPNPIAFGGKSILNFSFTGTLSGNPMPTITTLMPPSATAGGQAFTLTVNGTGFVSSSTVSFAGAAKTTTFVSATQLTAAILASDIATAGTKAVTVTNPAPGGGTSNSVNFTVNASGGTFTISGSAVPMAPAGSSGTSTITVTPSGGFTGTVNVTCPAAALPAGVTCTPNPLAINVTTTAAATGQLTLSVAAPSSSLMASTTPVDPTLYAAGTIPPSRGKGWWMLSAGTGLTAMFLLFLPGRKRYRAALGLGLLCVLSFALGCSNNSTSSGPVPTTTHISVMNTTKFASGTNIAFSITVTPTGTASVNGSVQLFDGATALGSPVTLSGGSASINSAGLLPGTHPISAKFTPSDTATMASNSGALNIAITGTTTFAITSTPAPSATPALINITIN